MEAQRRLEKEGMGEVDRALKANKELRSELRGMSESVETMQGVLQSLQEVVRNTGEDQARVNKQQLKTHEKVSQEIERMHEKVSLALTEPPELPRDLIYDADLTRVRQGPETPQFEPDTQPNSNPRAREDDS